MFTSAQPLVLSPSERTELETMAHSRTLHAALRTRFAVSDPTIARWRQRFVTQRVAGLRDRPRDGRGDRLAPAVEAKILALTQQPPPKPYTHWTTRRLAARLRLSHMTVHRVWQRAGLKPHRLERYVASPDPDLERKAADIIGIYLNPPTHAAVFCDDEKTAIQALDRRDPILPLSPGRAERHGFEYFRHGTLSLFAALNTATGEVLGKTAARHTSAEFVAFLTDIVIDQPRGKEIRVIADNLSAHKSALVKDFLAAHPKVRLHFTPTYSSWLNQVELWFSKIERDVIARGVFTSVPDLKRKLMRYIRHYNTAPKTVKWKYFDPTKRITSQSAVTGH